MPNSTGSGYSSAAAGGPGMWPPQHWQGGDGQPPQGQPNMAGQAAANHQAQPEEFSDMLRMLDPQPEFSDLSGMFNTFTD